MEALNVSRQSFSPPEDERGVVPRRRRLWEVSADCHCPVIGVCIPMPVLRRLAGKLLRAPETVSDYALHAHAVQEAARRNPLSQAIHDELEKRYATEVKVFRKLRDRHALVEAWSDALRQGNLAGALWATVTHPSCDSALSESLSQQMHMLQHQAGATMAQQRALIEENATLARALAKAQQRCEQVAREKAARIAELELMRSRLRGEAVAREEALVALQAELGQMRAEPAATECLRLAHQLLYQEERCARLSLENARLQKMLAAQTVRVEPVVDVVIPVPPPACSAAEAEAGLAGHRILCVGGRDGALGVYRKLIEAAGGRFMHHDGGVEDRLAQLDSALSAADLVICQTGCISHNAYWRVKEHCKRTGKRCAFVESPSAAGLARGLRGLLADELVEPGGAVQNASAGRLVAGLTQT